MRDELLNETLFTSLAQARVALGSWRADYNDARPHSRLGWKTPSEFAFTCHPPNRANPTTGANSELDETWGQGHVQSIYIEPKKSTIGAADFASPSGVLASTMHRGERDDIVIFLRPKKRVCMTSRGFRTWSSSPAETLPTSQQVGPPISVPRPFISRSELKKLLHRGSLSMSLRNFERQARVRHS